MQNKPEKISEEIMLSNKYRKIIWKNFRLKDWKTSQFLIYSHQNIKVATMVMPLTKDNKLILWREFRYWVEKFIYDFPVWVLESNISEIENVAKELREESWYISKDFDYIWETIVSSYEDTIIKYYIARNCVFWKQELENWEYIEVFEITVKDFENMIKNWEILSPTSLSCFTLARMKWLI